ncbi:MAG: response regulator [Ardenticatenaceae bacterium]|nr:response regulator [Ardenticatenaceae bacterium]
MTVSEHRGVDTAVFNPSLPEKRSHILIVDDEPEIAESLADFLIKKADFQVSSARDGQEAIDLLQSTVADDAVEIDLVLLDMRMPNLSGLDVLNWIRDHAMLKYTRVVLLTAAAGSSEKVEALTAGADDYITKPYRPQELLARVNTILRTQQLEKQLQRQSQQLAALNRIGQTVAATLEVSEVLAAAVEGVDPLLGVELSGVLMVEGGSHLRYQNLHGRGGPLPVTAVPTIPVGRGIFGTAYEEQKSVILNQPEGDGRFRPDVDAPPNFQVNTLIAAPLVVRGRPVGLINAFNKTDGRFTEVDLDLFASLASSISEAIENAWLFTRIRQRQQELLESRNTLQALIDGIPHPIYTINDDWRLIGINKSKADELDTVPEHLVNKVCYETFFNRSQPCSHCRAEQTLAQKQAQRWTINWKGDDHLPREWDVNAYPIPSRQASSARAVILWQDRTEERRLESSLLQAGKLAAIGQLAAGVAHEINNPLTAINANAEMLKMFIPQEDENYEAVDLIARAGDRATKVVRGLLDFARQEHYNLTTGDVNGSIQQTLDLVRYQLTSADAEVIRDMAENLPPIVGSWEHLKSVWLNLIVNARDAIYQMPAPRQISISTRLDNEEEHVQVIIQDNGKGMSEAELVHIFEPFYTTKDPGKGTGLGLATTHRIIEQHGGDINVVSAPNEGTTFIIRLPVNGNGNSNA